MTLGPRGRQFATVALVVLLVMWFGWRRRDRPAPATVARRAVWVWSDSVMRDPRARDTLIAWARRHRVDRVYQHVEPLLVQDPGAVEAFVRHLRRQGLRVEALLGDPAWIGAPDSALARLDYLFGMHDRLGTDTLTAVHLDVEPQGLPGWRTRRDTLVTAFQALVERLRDHRGTRTLPLHFDIPFWFDEISVSGDSTRSLTAWLVPRVDGVTVMAYLTDSTRLWPAIADEQRLARRAGIELTVGVETTCGPRPAITFCGVGRAGLLGMLAALDRRYGGDSTWRGTAIHSYPAATALLP